MVGSWFILVTIGVFMAGLVATVAILLRTPTKILDLSTRVAELEHQVAAQDVSVKKALRRAGIASKAQKMPADRPPAPSPPAPNASTEDREAEDEAPGLFEQLVKSGNGPAPAPAERPDSPADQLAKIRAAIRGRSLGGD